MECGIDFGTTFSSLAYFSDVGQAKQSCLTLAGSEFIPTSVYISDQGWYSIGRRAYSDYQRSPGGGRYYTNPKRYIGCTAANKYKYLVKLKPKFIVRNTARTGYSVDLEGSGGGKYSFLTPVEITYLFCRALLAEAEMATGKVVTGVVCTVPADYNSFKRSYLSVAFSEIGCPLRAFINEPTAAALAGSAAAKDKKRMVSVFDFGGGTFDVSFVGFLGNVATVILSVGDNYLGGRDVDRALLRMMASRVTGEYDQSIAEQLISECKEKLSSAVESYDLLLPTTTGVNKVVVTSADLREASEPLIKKAYNLFNKAVEELGRPKVELILTGGSSALPLVEEMGRNNPNVVRVNFDRGFFRLSVALGAKIYSDILTGASDLRLVDSLTHTLSDEVGGMVPKVVFPKGHAVPTRTTLSFNVGRSKVPYGVMEGEQPVSFLNELTFIATHTRGTTSPGTSVAEYSISLDGRINVSVDGKQLTNEMTPPGISSRVKSLKYRSAKEDYVEVGLGSYAEQFKDLHGVSITPNNIRQNSGAVIEKGIEENFIARWTD
uniref:HSP70-like protein n=2 Tax=unclassified Closteroviridae TaxID=217429 RepID=A0A7U3VD71_9CLOS|nr:HSP70-like protein [Closteroviridae sp.]UVT34985.1 HSP70-like protein [peony leafroll-associated virus]UXV25353.1 HSP70h [peony leafroll-associated virus]